MFWQLFGLSVWSFWVMSLLMWWSSPAFSQSLSWSVLWHKFFVVHFSRLSLLGFILCFDNCFEGPLDFCGHAFTNLTNEILLSSLSLNLLIFVPVYWCYWEVVGDHCVLFVIFGVWTLLCFYCKVTIHPEFCGCNMLCRRQYLWYFQNIPNFGEPYLSSLVHFQCV